MQPASSDSESLPRPLWGEAAARLRAAGEGPNLLKIPDVRRNRHPRRTKVPHPNPLPTRGEGIGGRTERVRQEIEVDSSNLTPSPFPSGKGSETGSGPFRRAKRLLRKIRFPFPLGKGLGVRFFGATAVLISTLALAAGCAQVHEKMFTLDCAIGRAPLAGELAPGTAMALDDSTSPTPLHFPSHRAIARCDSAGVVTMDIETPIDTGLSQLSTPLSTAASHITYVP